jgi:lipopolysaccharide/colanic/teichoic acid biosynthesis glycosyltransferase
MPLPPEALDEKLLKYSVASTKSYLESVLDASPIGAAILATTPPPLPVILMVPFTVKSPVQYITKPLQTRNGLNNTPLLIVKF